MQESARESAGWTKLEIGLGLAFLVIACTSLAWLVHPWYERANDATLYLLTARSLANGDGYSYLGEPFTVRPPGFSALLVPFVRGAHVDFHAVNLYVSAYGVACLAFLFALSRKRLGAWLAFALCLALWFNPAWQRLCNTVLSDVPGTALLLACLLVEHEFGRAHRGSWTRDALLGFAVGLASLVRSMNVLLVPAIACARVCEAWSDGARGKALAARIARRLLPLAAGAAVALAPWSLWSAANRPEGAVDQLYVHSYSTAMWHTDIGDPRSALRPTNEILGRIPERAEKLAALLGSRLQAPETGAVELVLGGLAFAGVLLALGRRRGAGEFFVVGAACMLLVFVSFLDRHALPVWLLAMVAALEGFVYVMGKLRTPAILARAAAVAAVASAAWVDWSPRRNWDVIEASHAQMSRYCAAVAKELPADARPAAQLGWHYALYLGRPVWSLTMEEKRNGPLAIGALLEKHRIDTVLLSDLMPVTPEVDAVLLARTRSRTEVELGSVLRLK